MFQCLGTSRPMNSVPQTVQVIWPNFSDGTKTTCFAGVTCKLPSRNIDVCGGVSFQDKLQLIRLKVVYKILVMRAQRVTRNERRNNDDDEKWLKRTPHRVILLPINNNYFPNDSIAKILGEDHDMIHVLVIKSITKSKRNKISKSIAGIRHTALRAEDYVVKRNTLGFGQAAFRLLIISAASSGSAFWK